MLGQLDDLDRRVVAGVHDGIGGERDLRQADGARVGALGGAEQAKGRHHGERHVLGPVVGPVGAEAQVYVDGGLVVALEPAGLEGEGAAERRPEGSVARGAHAAALGEGDEVSHRGIAKWMYVGLRRAHLRLYLQGYIHCMPNGNVSFSIRLLPLHPGYVRMTCAVANVDRSSVVSTEPCIL